MKLDISLDDAELTIMIAALNNYYGRNLRKAEKREKVRSKVTTDKLAKQQTLLQKLCRLKYEREVGESS